MEIREEIKEKTRQQFYNKLLKYYDSGADESDIVTLGSALEAAKNNYKWIGDYEIFGLNDEQEVIGFLSLGGGEEIECVDADLVLNEIFIFPEYRGNGYGTDLISRMEEDNKGLTIYLDSTDFNSDKFYDKLDYTALKGGQYVKEL